jgi:hypothetical protein
MKTLPPISDTEKLVAGARFKVLEERYREAGNVMQLSGLADSAHMGFYLSGDPGSDESGKGVIWVVMPLIRYDPKDPQNLKAHRPAPAWWGCKDDDFSDAAINDVMANVWPLNTCARPCPACASATAETLSEWYWRAFPAERSPGVGSVAPMPHARETSSAHSTKIHIQP